MAGYFDSIDVGDITGKQNGQGQFGSVPTLGTAYGTPSGQPGGVGTSELGAAAASDTGGGFNWSQYSPASDSTGGAEQAAIQGGGAGYYNTFVAPTGVDLQNDPGYQFRIDQAAKAQQASGFARGLGNTGGTQKAIGDAAQNQASAEYSNVFQRALAGFTENANVGIANGQIANQNASIANQANQFNAGQRSTYNQNQFNNLYSLADLGLRSATTGTQDAGTYGANSSNLSTGYGNSLANLLTGQGNTSAAGSVAQGNIWSSLPGTVGGVINQGIASYQGNKPAAPSAISPGDQYSGYAGTDDPYGLFRGNK